MVTNVLVKQAASLVTMGVLFGNIKLARRFMVRRLPPKSQQLSTKSPDYWIKQIAAGKKNLSGGNFQGVDFTNEVSSPPSKELDVETEYIDANFTNAVMEPI